MSLPRNYDYLFKIVLIGDANVGKSRILVKFVQDKEYLANAMSSIGIDFLIKTITINGKRIKLQMWDTAGQERYRTITSSYYRGAMGMVLVYDITQDKTFHNLHSWLANIRQFAEEHDMRFKEVSCELDINVDDVFYRLAEDILTNIESNSSFLPQPRDTVRPNNETRDRESCGC